MLRGFEHTMLDGVSCIAEGNAAIAISRGGAKKTYAYRDPNEDACGFACHPGGTLLVVADGHSGCDAAQLAVEFVVEDLAHELLEVERVDLWTERAPATVLSVHDQLIAASETHHAPRTTLAIAVVRPRDDCIAWVNVGDSLIFRADSQRVARLEALAKGVAYIGSPRDDRERLALSVTAGIAPLAGARALALATDGLSEEGIGVKTPSRAVERALEEAGAARNPDLRPLQAARRLAEIANRAHRKHDSGDNIATAIAWLEG